MRLLEIFEELKRNVPGTRAILWLSPDGAVLDHLRVDRSFDTNTFAAEYSTLLMIARRTSEDTYGGELREHILLSESGLTVVRLFDDGHFLILNCSSDVSIGRIRWELKRAARQIAGGGL